MAKQAFSEAMCFIDVNIESDLYTKYFIKTLSPGYYSNTVESRGISMRLQSIYKIRDFFLIFSHIVSPSTVESFSARSPANAMLFVLDKSAKIVVSSTAVDYPDLNAQEIWKTF